jgi:hypothetical protein
VIENELRQLLSERAGTVVDNPSRTGEVHSRITGIRRRRTAGAALVLVLLALAGALLTRLPGRPETLPAGVPSGPYFGDDGKDRSVQGYRGSAYFTFAGDATWSYAVQFPGAAHVVVVRCENRGDLTLRDLLGADRRIGCRVAVGDHYEGALTLPPAQVQSLPPATDVRVEPETPGDWRVGVLEPLFPDRLTAADLAGRPLSGYSGPGRIPVVVPSDLRTIGALHILVTCVRGVRLEIQLDDRPATTLTCTDADVIGYGAVTAEIPGADLLRLGLAPLQRVQVSARQVAGPAKQWAVNSVD